MSVRRLLGLSAAAAAVSGHLRRSLATAAAHPPWAMIHRNSLAAPDGHAPVHLCDPPQVSSVLAPMHLVKPSGIPDPDPDTGVIRLFPGSVVAASGDGLLLLSYFELRMSSTILAKYGKKPAKFDPDPDYVPDSRFVCNPVTGELSRLPDIVPGHVKEVMCGRGHHMGLLTRADRGHDGPPDRFAVAELQGNQMVRFLSETEEWETVAVSPCQIPHARPMVLDREVVAFGGRLWWLDVTCGAISADPFSDRPELCFVQLPRDSVLPATQDRCGCGKPGGCGTSMHRRLCVSQGRLWYIELSPEEPFLLSTFALDDEGSGWMLQDRRDLSPFQGCHHQSLRVGFLDPLNANCLYLSARIPTPKDEPGSSVVLVVDMNRDDMIRCYSCIWADPSFVPSVFPPWLGSSQIPSAGKKGIKKDKTLADVLVRAGSP